MKLTGTQHGDAANDLFAFYGEKASELEESKQYFIAATTLAFAVETAVLTYLLVEFGEDNGDELRIPSSVGMPELVEAANEFKVLDAPIDVPSHLNEDGDNTPPKHVAREAVEAMRKMRKLVHPARAIEEGFNPRAFTEQDYLEVRELYDSVMHSLLYYI